MTDEENTSESESVWGKMAKSIIESEKSASELAQEYKEELENDDR